jgi:nucleoside 2-deoxyribosyltransferase
MQLLNKRKTNKNEKYCLNCGERYLANDLAHQKFCSKKCFREYIGLNWGWRQIVEFLSGRKNVNYLITTAKQYIETRFNITIPKNTEIHHRDGDRNNNVIDNFLVMNSKSHYVIIHHKILEFLKEKNLLDEYYNWTKTKYKVEFTTLRDYIFTNGNSHLKFYLAGPMESVSASESERWRDKVTKDLLDYFGDKVFIYDPTKKEIDKIGPILEVTNVEDVKKRMSELKEKGEWGKFDAAAHKIITTDLDAVVKSSALIVLLDFNAKMGGTISELTIAYDCNIPVYAICYDKMEDTNSWVIGLVRKQGNIFKSIPKAMESIKENYKEYKKKC